MYDGITPSRLPADATLVAGYVDGHYANVQALRTRYPHATIVGIATSATTNGGQVLDVERGDATADQVPAWLKRRRAAGADPSVYCNAATWPAVMRACRAADVTEPHYWIANWNGTATLPAGATAHQYANHPGYDVSAVAAYWPGVDKAPVGAPPAPPHPTAASHTYTVQHGDTLGEIAETHSTTVAELVRLNHLPDPDLIFPGQVLTLTSSGGLTYTVKGGDTLSEIASAHGTSWPALAHLNHLSNPDVIVPGEILRLR